MFKNILVLFLFAGIFCFLGCDKPAKSSSFTLIKTLDEKSLSKIIENRNGDVLFVNVWATWCVPCVEEFPDIVKLYENYKNKNVDFLSLSVDLESDKDSLVIPFLKKQKAYFPAFIADEKSSEQIINLLNTEWSGAVPVSIFYDESGKRQIFLLGKQDYKTLRNCMDSVMSI